MKNKDIMTLALGGLLAATAHSLPVEHFYKFHKFRRAVEKANRALREAQVALLRDCGIDDPSMFDDAPAENQERFRIANSSLLDEDSGVAVKARIPFEFYKGLYDENKTATGDIFANLEVEAVVLDNLFTEPEEGSDNV